MIASLIIVSCALAGCGSSADKARIAELEQQVMDLGVQVEVLRQERDEARTAHGSPAERAAAILAAAEAAPATEGPEQAPGAAAMPAGATPVQIAKLSAGVTDQSNNFWQYAWRVELVNVTREAQKTQLGRVKFLGSDGLIVDYSLISAVTLAPGERRAVDGTELVELPQARGIRAIEAELGTSGGPATARLEAADTAPGPTAPVRQASRAPAPATRSGPAPKAELYELRSPRLTMVDRTGTVTGSLKNYGDADWSGYITARLITDGRDDNVTTKEFAAIQAGGSYNYTMTLHAFHPAQKRYDVRVTWSEQ